MIDMSPCAPFGKRVVRWCVANLYRLTANLIVHGLPARSWYSTVFLTTRVQIGILHPLALLGLYPYRRDITNWMLRRKIIMARIMDNWLRPIAAFRRPFPIPIQVRGAAAIQALSGQETGLILCSIHNFLADVALRAVAETIGSKLTVISRLPNPEKGYPLWGLNRTIAAIHPGGSVLLKARSILRRGGSVVVLLDRSIGTTLEPNILRLAHAVEAPIEFGIPELQIDGTIVLDLSQVGFLRGEDSVERTLASWQTQRDHVLHLRPRTTSAPKCKTLRQIHSWPSLAHRPLGYEVKEHIAASCPSTHRHL